MAMTTKPKAEELCLFLSDLIANRKIMIDKIQERLDLRTRFLAREITAQEVEIQDRIIINLLAHDSPSANMNFAYVLMTEP